jgi:hypothetical protein
MRSDDPQDCRSIPSLQTPAVTVSKMTTTTTRNADLEKNSSLQIDDVSSSEKDLKLDTPVDGADYTGAVGKTDPEEIALVRKLDYRIMPSLFCMYFL